VCSTSFEGSKELLCAAQHAGVCPPSDLRRFRASQSRPPHIRRGALGCGPPLPACAPSQLPGLVQAAIAALHAGAKEEFRSPFLVLGGDLNGTGCKQVALHLAGNVE
jgi:hypothetical protein